MDLKLRPEFEKTRVRRCHYPAPQEQVEEIERKIQECIDAGDYRFPWGAGHGTLRVTHTGDQAGKALRSQGHHYARVM